MNDSKIKIHKSKLQGQIELAGAKNSALRLLAASLLTEDTVTLSNYPASLLDTKIHVGMLEALGKKYSLPSADEIIIKQDSPLSAQLLWAERSIRNTLLKIGRASCRERG